MRAPKVLRAPTGTLVEAIQRPSERVDEIRTKSTDRENHLIDELRLGKIGRRDFVRRAAVAGMSLPLAGFIATACGAARDPLEEADPPQTGAAGAIAYRRQAGVADPRSPVSVRSARLEDDDRDRAVGPALVSVIAAIDPDDPRPQLGAFVVGGGASSHRAARAVHPELDVWVGDEVAIPLRIAVVAAL